MRSTTVVVFATLLLSASLIASFRQATFAQARTSESDRITLNTASLNFTNAHVDPFQNNQVIRAFVPTASRSVNCLATLNESNNAVPGIVLFCGEREPAAFGGVPGMLVSVFFPTPVPPDLVLSVTLYQQGARKYGTPVLCTANDGC